MCNNDYTIEDHRHRFAAWAASRAVSRVAGRGAEEGCKFSVELGSLLIEQAGLFDSAIDPAHLPSPNEFDAAHRRWREQIIIHAENRGLPFTHGVAAKLINVYLKSMIVCGGFHAHPNTQQVHPPIDRLLLDELFRQSAGELRTVWRSLRQRPWSKFDSSDYEKAINTIRQTVGDATLWKIESLWRGFR